MSLCLVVVVVIFVEVRLQSAEVHEGGEKVEEDLAHSGRADNLGQSDVVEALEDLKLIGFFFPNIKCYCNVILFLNQTKWTIL